MNITTRKLVLAALFLALAYILPLVTGGIPSIGNALLPMHLPIIICGFVCGWQYGLVVGFMAPISRSFIFGMPPMFPVAISMAFELAAYGMMAGILYRVFPKKLSYYFIELILVMFFGRIVWATTRLVFLQLFAIPFDFNILWTAAVVAAIPGMLLQLAVIPALVEFLTKKRLITD